MKIPFTRLNLWHQKRRTAIAIAGVTFSNVLIFMQLGFLGAAEASATLLIDRLDGDLIVTSAEYLDVNRSGDFARARLYQVLARPEVERIVPLYLDTGVWRIRAPADPLRNGLRRSIQVIAFDLHDSPLRLPGLSAKLHALQRTGTVLADTRSRDFFGDLSPGVQSELGLTRVEIVGAFTLGTGFGADGLLLTSDQTFVQAFGNRSLDRVNLGLVKLRPGVDPDAAARRLRQDLAGGTAGAPETIRVFTQQQLAEHETRFWVNQTSVGKIFTMGVVVALLVGIIFVYQVIASDIKGRLAEFATLKAIGYGNGYLNRVILAQALWYGVLGFIPAVGLSLLLYAWLARIARLPIAMSVPRAGGVFLLALGMCIVSGMLALRRVKTLDPADLF